VTVTPAEYARLIGHSENYVREYRIPKELRHSKDIQIELKIPAGKLVDLCPKTTRLESKERG